MKQLRINKSGKSYNVYKDSDMKEKIGTIGNREAYVLMGQEGPSWIKFRGPNLKLMEGFMDFDSPNSDIQMIDYPYGIATINGTKYKTFIMRRTMNVYTATGRYWGKVAGGMLVATNSSTCGQSHPTWKAVDYVKSTAGKWVKVDGDGYDHGFVDFDLGNGSMPSNIALYGSW